MSRVQIAVTFMDDSERFFPVPEGSGWRVRTEYGVPTLVIGALPPRVEVPLANVRYYEVARLRAGEGQPDPAEVEDVVRWAEQQARRCRSAFLFVDHGLAACGLPSGHAGPHDAGSGLQWDDTPTAGGPGVGDTGADRCPMAANQRGAHIPCERGASHEGLAHSNREHEIIWSA